MRRDGTLQVRDRWSSFEITGRELSSHVIRIYHEATSILGSPSQTVSNYEQPKSSKSCVLEQTCRGQSESWISTAFLCNKMRGRIQRVHANGTLAYRYPQYQPNCNRLEEAVLFESITIGSLETVNTWYHIVCDVGRSVGSRNLRSKQRHNICYAS